MRSAFASRRLSSRPAARTIVVDPCVGNGKPRTLPWWNDQAWPLAQRFGGGRLHPRGRRRRGPHPPPRRPRRLGHDPGRRRLGADLPQRRVPLHAGRTRLPHPARRRRRRPGDPGRLGAADPRRRAGRRRRPRRGPGRRPPPGPAGGHTRATPCCGSTAATAAGRAGGRRHPPPAPVRPTRRRLRVRRRPGPARLRRDLLVEVAESATSCSPPTSPPSRPAAWSTGTRRGPWRFVPVHPDQAGR